MLWYKDLNKPFELEKNNFFCTLHPCASKKLLNKFGLCVGHKWIEQSLWFAPIAQLSWIDNKHLQNQWRTLKNTTYSFALFVWSRKDLKQARLWPRMTCKFFFPILIDFKLSVMPLQNNMVCFCDSPIIVFFYKSSPVVPKQRFGNTIAIWDFIDCWPKNEL